MLGFFTELEGSLEKYIEGFFKDKFKGSLQAVEIAKRLAREMRDRRRFGLKEIYVPNRFEIKVGQEDFAAIKPLVDRLTTEMKEYVIGKAAEKKYTLLGPVTVNFEENAELSPGHLAVESFFDELPEVKQHVTVSEDTLRYTPARNVIPELRERGGPAELVVTEGALKGKRYTVDSGQAVIGRGQVCAICIPDSSISRRHAVISKIDNRYVIKDLSSTNGTFVNGRRITQINLSSDDVIKMGKTVLTFKVV